MQRKFFLSMLVAGALGLALGGCSSFAPVYGDASAGGLANARFNFAPPGNRLEQIILNRLAIAFPGQAGPDDPVLRVAAGGSSKPSSLSNALDVARPVATGVEATVSISQGETVVFSATRFTNTAYQSGKLTPTDALSATGAQETAARSTAESLRAAILAGYRPGMAAQGQ